MVLPFIFEYFDTSDEPRFPRAVLVTHVIYKGTQLGSIAGIATGLASAIRKRTFAPIFKHCTNGAIFGTVVIAPLMLFMKYRTYEDVKDCEFDRAYRLKYHETQNRCDKFSLVSSVAGAAIGATAYPPLGMAGGFCVGTALGVGLHVATSFTFTPDGQRVSLKEQWKQSRQKIG